MVELIRKTSTFSSTNGKNDVHYYVIEPAGEPKAIVQFLHGMAEHSERYVDFGNYLAENGVVFCISDQLGHGKSVKNDDELGYFGEKNGWKYLVEDAAKLTNIIKAQYPDIPYIIAGHSMGSFVTRAYISKYGDLADATVIIGTGNATPIISMGKVITSLIGLFKGKMYRSKMLDNLSFGSYNKKISNAYTSFDWLSTDTDNINEYVEDPYCGFVFTAAGFADVAEMMCFVSSKKWADSINKDLPVLLISGKEDPVGNYGEFPSKIEGMLKSSGVKDVTLRLFEGDRHEIINEADRPEVYRYILEWVKKISTKA